MEEAGKNQDKEKKLQEKFVEYQTVQQQLAQVQKKVQQLNEQKGDIGNLQQSLDELKEAEVQRKATKVH